MCDHENFISNVEVNRLQRSDEDSTIVGFSADIRIRCVACDEPFVFHGVPIGLLSDRPCISVDGTELRAPLRPQSSDPHFGLGLAGFEARVREGDPTSRN
jgi:hypothetical protein